jgi:hypothetical protein
MEPVLLGRPGHNCCRGRDAEIHFDAVGHLDERNATVHPVVLAQGSLSFIFLNVADFKGIRRGQDLREAQTDFET